MGIIKYGRGGLIVVELKTLGHDACASLNTAFHNPFRKLQLWLFGVFLEEIFFVEKTCGLVETVVVLFTNEGRPEGFVAAFYLKPYLFYFQKIDIAFIQELQVHVLRFFLEIELGKLEGVSTAFPLPWCYRFRIDYWLDLHLLNVDYYKNSGYTWKVGEVASPKNDSDFSAYKSG